MEGGTFDQESRRRRGAYYTPPEIARHITRLTLQPLLASNELPRVIDPACGDGIFLLSASELLAAASIDPHASPAVAQRQRGDIAIRCMHGIDINADAVTDCRQRIAGWILGNATDSAQHGKWIDRLRSNIIHADVLTHVTNPKKKFDCVLGNPPYINIRLASKTLNAALRDELRQRFHTARGAYDLYVLFLELGCRLLRCGGRYGWIIPNKLAGAGYARACRELLTSETTIDRWEDLSSVKVFAEAGVYPQIVIGSNRLPAKGHRTVAIRCSTSNATERQHVRLGASPWRMSTAFDVESRIDTIPLSDLATLHSGATGFQAQRLAAELIEDEGDAEQDCFTFITSGNIDRYRIDDSPVRFMKRRFQQAALPKTSPILTENKRRLYGSAKIVIAGMTKRLEAAYDRNGRALGVQVYAAIDIDCDPFYLLGVLNSRMMSDLFRERFSAKQLAGGYLSINKAQLAQLPIADPHQNQELARSIASLAKRLCRLHDARLIESAEQQIDRAVHTLYDLPADGIRNAA